MSKRGVRVVVGEGQPTRKGLLRFVLEGEGYDVVGEAASTMELAQTLAVNRPDVVVLDSGIDASAIGVTRELLPDAKVVLVWPRAVAPVGADASVDPIEMMTELGPAVERAMGTRGVVTTAPHRRGPSGGVIVVPEAAPPEQPPRPAEPPPEPARRAPPPPEPLEAPRWTYVAMSELDVGRERRRWWVAALAAGVAALLAAAAIAAAFALRDRTIEVASVIGRVPEGFVWPGAETVEPGGGDGVFTGPGLYQGPLKLRARGTIRLAAQGPLRLRTVGSVRLVARGDLRIAGDGVIRNTNGRSIRLRATGAVKVIGEGRIRVRVTGTARLRTDGRVRVSGSGAIRVQTRAR